MFALTTDDLLRVFRQEVADYRLLDDAAHPDLDSLWKDHEILQYMTEAADAVSKVVEGQFLTLTFAVTPALKTAPPVPVPIPLPRNLLHVREARLVDLGLRIEPSRANAPTAAFAMDYGYAPQVSARYSYGTPREYVRDFDQQALFLLPIPQITDTLELQCSMTIAVPLEYGMPLPFTDATDLRLMLHYMKKLAYAKHDADTLDMQRSMQFGQQFQAEARDREVRLRSYRRLPGTATMNW